MGAAVPVGIARGWRGVKRDDLLPIMLQVAVPPLINRLSRMCAERFEQTLLEWQEEGVEQVSSHGDAIMYGSKERGETAAGFAGMARGLAAGAHSPGGAAF